MGNDACPYKEVIKSAREDRPHPGAGGSVNGGVPNPPAVTGIKFAKI
jgi:hypothetical protein